jgi:hypothetical protein
MSLKDLAALEYQARYQDKPDYPEYARTKKSYSDRTANGLTRAIIDWIRLNGGHAERVNVQGRPIDRTQVTTNTLGQRQRIGSIEWIPGGGTRGSADIHGIINGKAVYIEVKIGRDKLSQAQKQYRDNVTQAGAVYFVARDFEGFTEFYNEIAPEATGAGIAKN